MIGGFLFSGGPQLIDVMSVFLGRALGLHGKELVQLAGETIRNVSRGVIGISFLRAFVAGAGFLAAGIPAARPRLRTLLLSIKKIGSTILFIPIVVWSWLVMDTGHALMFTAYVVQVGLIDNALRPLLMARGLTNANAGNPDRHHRRHDGLWNSWAVLRPFVLSVAWTVMNAWVQGDVAGETRCYCSYGSHTMLHATG